ncbi:MXAN_2562 family outer membrane beta-barrel protein [Paraliomyxa miuraensis]|uniref:MXAN_2562 family outer membrane beta-barrel protein n=1 Tax=Paraliomyxa miuraensis TaxID=376150 RepID=UPI002250F3B5|nr:MXAN_2562 family outer membrane beta-barrel protein [Paraliomyxa miuraensis]MCX4243378.1 MXAN_2562 family outer membrane beta-barrel protein [Paraliomyxa miuraensis]
MSGSLLWLTAPLWTLATAWAPPPPPDPEDDDLVLEDELVDEDADAPTTELSDDEPIDDGEGDDDDPTEGTAPPPPPAPKPPGVIPTEGPTKPPPSSEALRRDDPLAQPDPERRDRAGRTGSPQRFALEFKMGPYLPNVDREYSGSGLGPYATVFGETDDTGAAIDQPKAFPMPAIAFDWQFLYLAGPLGIGTQIGLFRDGAQALIANPAEGENLRSLADRTTFTMLPLSVLLSYRFELLADRLRVPLVPYGKAGLGYHLYWVKAGTGSVARNSQGEAGRGGVLGWQLNAGGMLRLDFIEPGTAKKLDIVTGINHTYVFGEFQYSRIDNFGVGRSISLGDATWFVGLAIEF